MWKFAILLFVLGSTAAQEPIEINCQFLENVFGDYVCRFIGIEVTDPNQPVQIGGNHATGRSNSDVNIVQVRNSNTPFVIQQFFTAFPNLIELDIQNSNLQELSLSESVQLEYLTLYRNNITVIRNGTFAGQTQLEFIEAIDNRIEEIEENAFEDLENLVGLILIGNRISRIGSSVLHPLVSMIFLDLERNRVDRIEDDAFSANPDLEVLYLEYNQINAVSPTFTSSLSPKFEYLNLIGNRCVDRPFSIREQYDIILLNNALNSCFQNFVGQTPERRRITLEFTGPLSLFDEFGNIIARVN